MDVKKLSKIIQTSEGKIAADLVIRNCKVLDPISGSIIVGDIAVTDGYILGVGAYDGKEIVDANGAYATSGLIDSHVHIESSLCTPEAFAEIVVPFGTTSVVADPHEIANVKGVDGIRFMINSSKNVPLKYHFMIPSCVPATGFEDSGAILDAKEVGKLLKEEEILGLGEMMNSPGLLSCDEDVLEKLCEAWNVGKPVDGHGPMLEGKNLNAYRVSGVKTDHECVSVAELRDRISRGMYVLLRHGSAAQNLETLLEGVNASNSRRCTLCTDDKHSGDIIKNGHITHSLKIAVSKGFDVFTAIAMATINAAECYNLKNTGLIAPGYKADIVLFEDLVNFKVNKVFIDGRLVAENGKALFKVENKVDKAVTHSVNIAPLTLDNLKLPLKSDEAHVIRLIKYDLVTEGVTRLVGVKDGYFNYRENIDILKIVVVERHKATGKVGIGLVENYKLKGGAVATTIGHDSHNLIAIGDNDEDILTAIKELESIGGGITMVKRGKVLDTLRLKIGGIMSDQSGYAVSEKIEAMNEIAFRELHVNGNIDPFMTLSFLCLPVIPDLKLTPRGLFDVNKFKFIDISA